MASAANGQTLTATPTTLFNSANDGGECEVFFVKARSGASANVVQVNIPGLHLAGQFAGIVPGDPPAYFRLGMSTQGGISTVTAQTDTGTATIDYGVAAKF